MHTTKRFEKCSATKYIKLKKIIQIQMVEVRLSRPFGSRTRLCIIYTFESKDKPLHKKDDYNLNLVYYYY